MGSEQKKMCEHISAYLHGTYTNSTNLSCIFTYVQAHRWIFKRKARQGPSCKGRRETGGKSLERLKRKGEFVTLFAWRARGNFPFSPRVKLAS